MAKYCFGNFLTLFRIVFPPPFQSQTAFSTLLSVLPSLPFIIVLCCVWGFLLLLLVFCRIKSLCAHKMDFDSHGARRGWGVSERAHKSQWFLRKSFSCYFWIWKKFPLFVLLVALWVCLHAGAGSCPRRYQWLKSVSFGSDHLLDGSSAWEKTLSFCGF